jgi:hypothetical protein
MNKFSFCLLTLIKLFVIQNIALANEDRFIALDGKVMFVQDSKSWLKLTIPFRVLELPDFLADAGKSQNPENVINDKFLDDLKIKVVICCRNEFVRKELRGDKKDIRFNEYFSSEMELITTEIDRSIKKEAHFLFPKAIADKMELGSYPDLVGYAIEFSVKGNLMEISNGIYFDRYKSQDVLDKFQAEAWNKSSKNENILIPGHLIYPNYLDDLGPAKRDSQ